MPTQALAKTLKDVFNTANPIPLQSGDRRYVDCTAVRGNEDVVALMFNMINWSDQPMTAQLFTGHRGCGKSTELFRLKKRLEDAGYAVIYFEADEAIDVEDVVYSDVLVAIAQQVFGGLQTLGVKLDDDLLDDIFAWFAEMVYEKANTKEFQARLGAEFIVGLPQVLCPAGATTGKDHRPTANRRGVAQDIRASSIRKSPSLIERINLLIQVGAGTAQAGEAGLVIIVDNLDRIPFRKLDDDRSNHDALYIEHGEQLREPALSPGLHRAHRRLYSKNVKVLTGIFPDCRVLPMIKTHTPQNQPCPEGLATLRRILAERIELDEVFEEPALERCAPKSGGHPRILMTLVRYACEYAANRYPKPIDAHAVERAISRFTSEYSRSVPEEYFPLLVKVYPRQEVRQRRRVPRHAAQPDRAGIHERPGAVARRPSVGAAAGQVSECVERCLSAQTISPPLRILASLDRLVRSIDLAEGFALFFARCNIPVLRSELILTATEQLAALRRRSGRGRL